MRVENKLIRKAKLLYSSSPRVKTLVDLLAGSPFYFWWVKKWVAWRKEKDKKGPFNLVIETSNFCNARCVMCPYRTMKRANEASQENYG
jgi:2-iminoacetate synthase ThiH